MPLFGNAFVNGENHKQIMYTVNKGFRMNMSRFWCCLLLTMILCGNGVMLFPAAVRAAEVDGDLKVWHPLTLTFAGPAATATDNSPNPFLDIRLDVTLTSRTGRKVVVPGFFDGDGKGGAAGNAWRIHFMADEPGEWGYSADFRSGPAVAVSSDASEGTTLEYPGTTGHITVSPRDPEAPGFLKWGRLAYAGRHYLKFQDGPYWIRGGTDEPENLLGYAGFDDTPAKHTYANHLVDWREGDPDWGDGRGRAIIGALNYLAEQHVNSIYFLLMNIGGDGKDVWPWIGPINPKGDSANDNLHFNVGKLRQWEMVFAHAQRKGIALHVVFNEAEEANKRELDNGELGTERRLYYREMIARFGHHPAMQWNLCEEFNLNFDLGPERIRAFAEYIRAVDPYDHPITVHTVGDPVEELRPIYGDPRFDLTSVQLNQRPIHQVTEDIRAATVRAGRPLPVSLDEFTLDRGQRASHIPVDDADGHRREKLWPTYLSGGMIEFILEDLLKTDDFKKPEREKLWKYMWYARRFMENELPFQDMEPADQLSSDGGTIAVRTGKNKTVALGPQVLAKRGEIYAVYVPVAEKSGQLDLSELTGSAELQWYNPRTGEFDGPGRVIAGGGQCVLGVPTVEQDQEWVVLIRRKP